MMQAQTHTEHRTQIPVPPPEATKNPPSVRQSTRRPVLRIPAAGGASVAGRLTSTGGISTTGGGGNYLAGAYLRLLSNGDLVNNTATLGFGNLGVELHMFELSWLGYNHFMRPNASTAWTNTMSIESTGRWRFRKGAYVDGQLAAGTIALNGVDLATTLANLSSCGEATSLAQ